MKAYKLGAVQAAIRGNKHLGSKLNYLYLAYKAIVEADGGSISSEILTEQAFLSLKEQDSIDLAWMAGMGTKSDIGYNSVSYIYSTNQIGLIREIGYSPFYKRKLISKQFEAISNPNNELRRLLRPDSFIKSSTDKWTFTLCVNDNFTNSASSHAGAIVGDYAKYIALSGSNLPSILRFYNGTSTITFPKKNHIGKTTIYHIVADGSGNLSFYENGGFIDTKTGNTSFVFRAFLTGYTTRKFCGDLYAVMLRSNEMTAQQISSEYDFLRSKYPEICSTAIAAQVWSVDNLNFVYTQSGNEIPNITDNAAWANATTLYNNAYDAKVGTEEEKVYEGVKAAAMWCYYDNDVEKGSIYNKLYNFYAVKLIQMDIDYFNTANPGNTWGWRIPLDNDWALLETTATADELKHDTDEFWGDGNTGTNSTQFTSLPGGYRDVDGTFKELGVSSNYWGADWPDDLTEMVGMSVRLIQE